MNTFEITIQRKSGDTWPVIAEQSRPGSFLPLRSEGVLAVEPERLLAILNPRDYGTHLGQALFTGSIRDGFTRALADSQNDLRVLLFVEADDLRTLRWERLCAPLTGHWDFLALDQQVLFSLYLPSVTDSRFPAIGRRDLRALVVAASPDGLEKYGLSHFDLPNAIACATESLGEIPYDLLASGAGVADHPTIKPVGPASLDAIAVRLTQERYTLLHIVGHGSYNKRTGETSLFLADNAGYLRRITATALIERLGDIGDASTLPHFTFLSTCESAAPEAEGALGGLGQRLVRDLGMPAVIAMTEKVSVVTALALAKAFYRQLRQHGEVDRAIVEASAGLSGATDATVPALYSRLGGRPLFSDLLAQDRPLTMAEIRYGLEELGHRLNARAPVLADHFSALAAQVRLTLTAENASLSPTLRQEQADLLKAVDALSSEAVDLSFKALALGQEAPTYDERCPYLGLAAFQAANRAFFFGREPLVQKLVNRLAEQNFLAVLGGSGSGKSSLVLAGLVPALQAQTPNLAVRYLTPTSNPVAQLDRTLAETVIDTVDNAPQLIVVDQFEELFTLCADVPQRQAFLDRLLALLNEPKAKSQSLPSSEVQGQKSKIKNQKSKIKSLPSSEAKGPKAKLVLTMRADFWGECATYPKLRELMQMHQELVGPMTAQELRSSMEQQARVVGLRFETDLSNTILDDVAGEPGAMPLLQHALLELWKRRHGRWLRADEYRSLGGVQQAIARTADSIYTAQEDADRERMRAIFLRLTRLNDGNEADGGQRDTRRRARLEELAADGDEAAVRNLVQRLADARLVMTTVRETTTPPPALPQPGGGTDPSAGPQLPPLGEGPSGHPGGGSFVEVEVTHEALIRHWPRLRTWLDEDRSALRLRQEISNAAAQWQAHNQADELLPRWNVRLEEAQRLAQNPRFGFNQQERAYLTACVALREREAAAKEAQRQHELQQAQALAAEQRQRAEEQTVAAANLRKRAIFLALAGALAVLLALAAGWFGFQSNQNFVRAEANLVEANTQRQTAETRRQEAEAAKVEANTQRDLATQNEAEAQTQAQLAFSRQLSAQADKERSNGNLDLALLLSIEAVRTSETQEALTALRNDLAAPRRSVLRIAAHNSPLTEARWNKDQSRVLTTSEEGAASVWDAHSGKLIFDLIGHTARINRAEWYSSELRILTAADDGTARIWDATNGVQLALIHADDNAVNDAIWSLDGRQIVTAGQDGTVRIWDVQTKEEVRRFEGHNEPVQGLQWSKDGSYLLTFGHDGTARIWKVATGKELVKMTSHTTWVNSARWNADESRVLTANDDGTASIWDSQSGGELLQLKGHTDSVYKAEWSPDGRHIATASYDKTARIWDAATGNVQVTLAGHTAAVSRVLWSLTGDRILTTSDDATARIWDATTGRLLVTFFGHTGVLTDAHWNVDETQLLTAGGDGTIRIWKVALTTQAAGELPLLVGHSGGVYRAAWNKTNDQVLTASADGVARIWNVQTGEVLITLQGHTDWLQDVQWNKAEDHVLTASEDKTARIWDASTGQEVLKFSHQGWLFSARWSPDEMRVVTASQDKTAKIWDTHSGLLLQTLTGHSDSIWQAVWNHDGSRVLTASADGSTRVWDATTGEQILFLEGHTDGVEMAIWNRAENRIFTASDDTTAKLWDALNGKLLATFDGHTGAVYIVRLNAAEDMLLTASADGTVRVWNLRGPNGRGQEILQLRHNGPVEDARWNAAEDRILTASDDGMARLWDAQSGAVLATLTGHTDIVFRSLWSHDESRILTVSADGTARQFYMDTPDIVAAACAQAIRNMTQDEWAAFMQNQPYRTTCSNLPGSR